MQFILGRYGLIVFEEASPLMAVYVRELLCEVNRFLSKKRPNRFCHVVVGN